jgi:hypothetical protein
LPVDAPRDRALTRALTILAHTGSMGDHHQKSVPTRR